MRTSCTSWKYTNTMYLKDQTCALFLKSMGFKDFKYDIPLYQMWNTQICTYIFTLHLHITLTHGYYFLLYLCNGYWFLLYLCQWLLVYSIFISMAPSLFYIYAMATSFFYIYAMANSFFYIYEMATSFFYIYAMATSFFYIYAMVTSFFLGRLYLHSCANNSEFICTASIIGLVWLLALSET